jgi:transcriptional regulator with XRE-family HTH domain
MVRAKCRARGRPRKRETKLSLWLDAAGITRDALAKQLELARGYVDLICSGSRRPSLEVALRIEKLTRGAVPASSWLTAPKHSRD